MASLTGRRLPLSMPRRLVGDLLRASRQVPLVSFERRMRLGPLLEARRNLADPPSWALLFVKAFALVAEKRPELRRAYLSWPWPHLWEATETHATLVIEREYHGESGAFFATFRSPERQTLPEMMETLRHWKTAPIEDVGAFQRGLKYARWPWPVRRLLWWLAVSWSGKLKARNLGTCAVSVTASAGASGLTLICPLTTTLNYGPFQPDGSLDVRLHFDHRVLDGVPAARALAELEDVLCGPIVDELRSLAAAAPPVVWSARVRLGDHGL